MTYREFFRELVAERERRFEANDRAMHLAWHIEALHRQKRLPSLSSLASKRRGQEQTQEEMSVALRTLSEQYGIPMTGAGRA